MPNYKTHDKVAYITSPLWIGSCFFLLPVDQLCILAAGYFIGNHWLSPDLDIASIMNRRWSLLRIIWYPYRRIIHHRSFYSHSGPLSAALRILYLSMWICIPALLLVPVNIFITAILAYLPYIAAFYYGVAISDTVHTVLDHIYSEGN